MNKKEEFKIAFYLGAVFLAFYFLPLGNARFDGAVDEALELTKWYAREHVVLCLLPAFWIAGGIAAFISQGSVMRYLGPKAPKPLAYGVGAVSGTILAVCSCTVLPLFAGIYRMGAGLGPATAFLYSGPAINALAIILTSKILGFELGMARAISAMVFSVLIGLSMAFIFRKEEHESAKIAHIPVDEPVRSLWQTAAFFMTMVGILVFSNWGSGGDSCGFFGWVFIYKWKITSSLALLFAYMLWRWMKLPLWKIVLSALALILVGFVSNGSPIWIFIIAMVALTWLTAGREDENGEWFEQSWTYAKQIMPLLLGGVLIAGFLLGQPGSEGIIPSDWIAKSVGGNSIGANLFASIAGAFMYFATLTEIPILQGLLGNGMGAGPSLTLLLAGPALSLPNMLVINSVIGPRKTFAYVVLVVFMSAFTGWIYGMII